MIIGHLNSGAQIENVISLRSNLDVAEGEKSPVFAQFAQRQLKVMEKEIRDEKEKSENEKDKKIEKIIKLSMESGVMCKETSYVAASQNSYVEQEDTPEIVEEKSHCWSEIPTIEEACFCSVVMPEKIEKKSRCWSEIPTIEEYNDADEYKPRPPPLRSSHAHVSRPMEELSCAPHPRPEESTAQPEPEPEEKEETKPAWNEDVKEVDVVRLQSRDGFWDLPSNFVTEKCGGASVEIGLDLSESPIIKKRVVSTVFSLAYLKKFFETSNGKWRSAKEKGLKWLRRIEASVNWIDIIKYLIPSISK